MQSLSLVRIGAFALAVLLGGHAAWMLTLEMMRPSPRSFPIADTVSTNWDRDWAAAAAQLGVIRGDLWADDAILLASGLLDEKAAGTAGRAPQALEAARGVAERAARLAPHDSRMWLLLAAIDARLERRPEAMLKMSYYTAPNDVALMALRLQIATRSEAISDPDLQVLVSGEMRSILKKAGIEARDRLRLPGRPGNRPPVHRGRPGKPRSSVSHIYPDAGDTALKADEVGRPRGSSAPGR
jgi:hypothetical protein